MKIQNLITSIAVTGFVFASAGSVVANPYTGTQSSGQYSHGDAGGNATVEGGPGNAATGSTSFGDSWAVQNGGPGVRIYEYENGGYEQVGLPGMDMPANSAHQAQQQTIGNESYATFEGQNGNVNSHSGSGLEMGQDQQWNN